MVAFSRAIPVLICLAFSAGSPTQAQPLPPKATALPGANQDSSPKIPAPLPGTKTAAHTFSEMLGMTPAELTLALADRTPPQRPFIEERLREFRALPDPNRNARLDQLEIRSQLIGLMKLAPTDRTERLKLVSPALLPVVQEQLRRWDSLPPAIRQQALQYDSTAGYFLRVTPPGANPSINTNTITPPPGIQDAGPSSRSAVAATRVFEMAPKEQQKVLENLPPDERDEMEKTLIQFAHLPAAQRKICIDSFARFSRMSKEERTQFMQNAERWKAMSVGERQTWRALVNTLPPTAMESSPPALPLSAEAGGPPVAASNSTALPGGGK